ncbi:MAG: hypothetical protein Fur0024_1430 [Patescibacteria group bacterium]
MQNEKILILIGTIILLALLIVFLIYAMPVYIVGIFFHAPFVPTSHKMVDKLLKLADFKSGDIVIELGSGDGRFLRKAGKLFDIKGIGYEWVWWLVKFSNFMAKKEKISERIKFEQGNFFDKNLKSADWIVIYLMPHAMDKLVKKMKKELKKGTKILSHAFSVPNLKLLKELPKDQDGGRVFLYEI